ncbi:MAG: hypothetical protein WA865_20670 [Spirulinaceae cyanobacterium]
MNKKTTKEFYVDSVVKLDAIYWISGSCDKGCIKTGDTFSEAYQLTIKKSLPGEPYYFEITGRKDIRDIKLQVVNIRSYRRDFDQLHKGMTGELYLQGEGGNYLKERDKLGVY